MVRYGIVGFGLHAVKRLMPGFQQAKESKVVALSRRDPAKARTSAEQYRIPHFFTSTEELCRCPEVDAVFVTSPNSMHVSDVLTAVAHGKHVLCEKPLAMDLGEAVQMVDAARAARVLFGVAHCFRFERSLHRFRERIAAGEIGKPIFARAEFSYPAVQHARTWITDAAVSGGGPLADVGVHCIDALRYVLEDDPVSVQAFTQYDRHSGEVESAAVANLFFLRGTLATVLVSTRAEYRTPLEFVGTEGVLRAEYALNVEFPLRMELVKGGQIVDSEEILNEAVYAKQVDAFSAAVVQNAPFPVPGEEGARNQAILDAAYRSARTGQAESISYPY